MKTKAVFLDRDGTINHDVGYLSRTEEFVFIPGAEKAIKLLKENGFLVIVISNQSGIGRGLHTEKEVHAIHELLQDELLRAGTEVDEICFCPHTPEESCDCRKPNPKMVQEAAERFNIDLKKSYFVGDKTSDVETGQVAGCQTILVAKNADSALYDNDPLEKQPDHRTLTLIEAVDWILKDSDQS